MGTWGTNILENDAAMDVYCQFENMYYEKKDLSEIKKSIQQSYLFDSNNKPVLHDNTSRWLAYAHICWECQVLDKETTEVVDQIVEQEIDADNWEELWIKRKKEVEKFRKKIAIPAKKIKTIPRFFKLVPPFEMGDCLTFKFEDGMYGGAICTSIVTKHKEQAYHTWHFAWIKWYSQQRPTTEDFYSSYFLAAKYPTYDHPYITYMENNMHYSFTGKIREAAEFKEIKNEMDGLEVVGKLRMKEPLEARGGNMCFDLSKLGSWKLKQIQDREPTSHEFAVKNFCELQ